ncbi:MAG: arylsulfatase B [Myxococcota bacterium]|jgi:arylsulfatase B
MRPLLALILVAAGCVSNDKPSDTSADRDAPPSAPGVVLDGVDSSQPLVLRVVSPSVDPEGAAVTLAYTWAVDGAPADDMSSDTVPADRHARGERWEVSVTASDGANTSEPVVAETVIGNAPPTAVVVISPGAPTSGDDLVASANASDAEDDPVTVAWSWTVDGEPSDIVGPIVTAAATAKDQLWEVRAVPNDGFDDGLAVRSTVVVGNLPPVVSSVILSPDVPDAGTSIVAAVSVSDPDDDPVDLLFSWTVDGEVVQESESDSLAPGAFARDQAVVVTVTPSDPLQSGAPVASDAVTVRNAVPRILSIMLDADEVDQDDVIGIDAVVSEDADGDEVTWSVQWQLDGAPVPDATEPALPVDGIARDSLLSAVLTPTDGLDVGVPVESPSVTVGNTPPRLLDAVLGPDPAMESSLVRFIVDIVDPDRDPLDITYTWRVDGGVVQEGPISSLTGALYDRDQVIDVTLAVSDGEDVSVLDAGPIDVVNSPPTVDSVELSAVLLTERDAVTCEPVGASDADGDPVYLEVVWVVNGFDLDIGPVLDGRWFDRGDEVWCAAEPTDGITRGEVFESAHLIVQNSAPDAAGPPRVEPTEFRMGFDSLSCVAEGPYPADPDRDLVALRTVWYSAGVEADVRPTNTLYEGDTLPAHEAAAGRDWTCSFTAVDAAYGAESPGPIGSPAAGAGVGGNVLIVLLDDVGTDMVGVYAEHPDPPPTPNIDALAAEGVLFRNAYSAPVCSPTRAAMLTGRLGRRYGIGVIVDAWEVLHPLPDSEQLLPAVLDRSLDFAYANSLTGKWHLGNTIQGLTHPADMGFDWHAGSMDNLRTPTDIDDGREKTYEMWAKNTNGELAWEDTYATTDSIDDAIARMAAMPEPWLLYVPLNAAHSPVHMPPDHLHTQDVSEEDGDAVKFRAVIEATDTEIGRLLSAMSAPVAARTTVMVIGDNGTPDWAITPPRAAPQYKGTLYEGGTNVPFIVRSPHVLAPGSESAALVYVTDVFSTAATLAGVPVAQLTREDLAGGPDQDVVVDGLSLLPFLADPDHPSLRETLYTERFADNGIGPYLEEDRRAVRNERWKLMRIQVEGGPVEDRLFDLEGRFVEGVDLLAEGPLSPEGEAAYEELKAALAEQVLELEYDVPALPPVVRDVSISPTDPVAGERLICEVGFYGDLNPDDVVTLTYDWAVGEVWLGLDNPGFDSGVAGPGARVQCSVTPDDGVLEGEPGFAEVVLGG